MIELDVTEKPPPQHPPPHVSVPAPYGHHLRRQQPPAPRTRSSW
jgi:hypothetical protein